MRKGEPVNLENNLRQSPQNEIDKKKINNNNDHVIILLLGLGLHIQLKKQRKLQRNCKQRI